MIQNVIIEILTSKNDGSGVKVITTNIKSGDEIEIMGLNRKFTRVSHVQSKPLTAGYHTVGKDIKAGKYKMTTPSGSGKFGYIQGEQFVGK